MPEYMIWIDGLALMGLIIASGLLTTITGMWLVFEAIQRSKQAKCKHEEYFEAQSCDAICTNCGKNLGFIGAIRDVPKND